MPKFTHPALTGLGVVLTLATLACTSTNYRGDFLAAGRPPEIVKGLTRAAGTDKVLELVLGHSEASVKVVKAKSVQSWTVTDGDSEPAKGVSASLESAKGRHPFSTKQLDTEAVARSLTSSDVGDGCSVRGIHAQVLATVFDGVTVTHLSCLDTSQHRWLDPDLKPYATVDLRTSQGVVTAMSDLDRVAHPDKLFNVTVVFGENSGVSFELPGPCGNPADCLANRVTRNSTVAGNEIPLDTGAVTPRLNYAVAVPRSAIDPAKLYAAIDRAMRERGLSLDGSFAVTAYQAAGKEPVLEFNVDQSVFRTDLNGGSVS